MSGLGLQRSSRRNILELLVYYLTPNKCKNLKDMKSSCLSICTSIAFIYRGSIFLALLHVIRALIVRILSHVFESTMLRKKIMIRRNIDSERSLNTFSS